LLSSAGSIESEAIVCCRDYVGASDPGCQERRPIVDTNEVEGSISKSHSVGQTVHNEREVIESHDTTRTGTSGKILKSGNGSTRFYNSRAEFAT